MAKRPTIIDVAKCAGVSKSTVSLVLQNNTAVKAATREKVLQAIQETKYIYNRAAANLRGSSIGLIGLIINDLRNPYYTELAASVQMFFTSRGYSTIIGNANEDPELQSQLIDSMIEHGVSALIIAPCYGAEDDVFKGVFDSEIPTLQVLRCIDSRLDIFPFHSMDYEQGSYIATDYLIKKGIEDIVFVGGIEEREVTQERKRGYIDRMTENGSTVKSFHGSTDRAYGYDLAIKIACEFKNIRAAIAFNDLVALGMLAGFSSVGVKVGQDFHLIGFDDIEEASQCFPKLSSVKCDVNDFGMKTANILLNWLEEGVRPKNLVRYPVELIQRASSGLIKHE